LETTLTPKKLKDLRTAQILREGLRRTVEGKDLPDDPRDLLTATTEKEVK